MLLALVEVSESLEFVLPSSDLLEKNNIIFHFFIFMSIHMRVEWRQRQNTKSYSYVLVFTSGWMKDFVNCCKESETSYLAWFLVDDKLVRAAVKKVP